MRSPLVLGLLFLSGGLPGQPQEPSAVPNERRARVEFRLGMLKHGLGDDRCGRQTAFSAEMSLPVRIAVRLGVRGHLSEPGGPLLFGGTIGLVGSKTPDCT